MAPGSVSPVYLPDLGKCFAGDLLLPSWEDLLDAILSHDTRKCEQAIEILSGDRPKQVLSKLHPTLPPPSANSKTAFDTTVGTVPTISDLYNIDEIKSDALWLSKQENLDELEALRIVTLEWQYRPEARLNSGPSEAEFASLRQALGADYLSRHQQTGSRPRPSDDQAFDTQAARRSRLISNLFSQKVAVFRIHRHLLDVQLLPKEVLYWFPKLNSFATDVLPLPGRTDLDETVESYISSISTLLEALQNAREWDFDEVDSLVLDEVFHTTTLEQISILVEELLLIVRSSESACSTKSLLSWLELVGLYGHFDSFDSTIPQQRRAIQSLRISAASVSVSLFNPGASVSIMSEAATSTPALRPTGSTSYFLDPEAACEIQDRLSGPAIARNVSASLAILAWAVVLQQIRQSALAAREHRELSIHASTTAYDTATSRRGSSGSGASIQQSIFEDIWDTIKENSPDDPETNEKLDSIDLMLEAAAVQCHAFDFISYLALETESALTMLSAFKLQTLQELVTVSLAFLNYTPELVTAQLALMSPKPNASHNPMLFDPTMAVLEDDSLLQGFYEVSAARFPYETLPFLKFSKELAKAKIFSNGVHFVEYRLKNFTTFTQAAIRGVEFKTTRENENANLVALTKSVNLLDMSQHLLLAHSEQQPETVEIMPAETVGEVISGDSLPSVIRWHYEFSGLAHIGKLIELYYMGLASTALSDFESPKEVAAEILSLIAVLITTITLVDEDDKEEAQWHASRVINELSSHLSGEMNFTSYVFEVLEQELQAFRRRSTPTFDCRVLVACLDFIIVFTRIHPNQVWSNINKTSLFNRQVEGGLIMSIASSVEIPLRRYEFLEKCTRVYHALVDSALASPLCEATASKGEVSKRSTVNTSILQRNQAPLLLAATEILFAAFQQLQSWPFESQAQATRIRSRIAKAFSDIISFTFNFGETVKSCQRTSVAFADAAEFLVTAFRPGTSDNITAAPIIKFFYEVTSVDIDQERNEGHGQVKAILELATLLVRYSQILDLPPTSFEIHLFHAMPTLIRILHNFSSIRPTCLTLIRSLLTYLDKHQSSSLLTNLGAASSLDFLHLLKHVHQSGESNKARDEVWRLLPVLVNGSQHWLATVILTGSSPDASRKAKGEDKPKQLLRGSSFLKVAVSELTVISSLSYFVAISMLEFVLQAQSTWTWVTDSIGSSEALFTKIISFVTNSTIEANDQVGRALHNSIAALVTDLSTIHLHHSKVAQDQNAIKRYTPLLIWLSENAIRVSGYNASLHTNLKKNFASKYLGLTVSSIRRTGLIERRYGINFFYDIDFANRFLSSDTFWSGGGSVPADKSFAAEFRRANANLSLVDSELALLFSLQHFCAEHAKLFAQEREDQKLLASIVRNCLESNSENYPPEAIFDTLFQTRSDLSTALLRKLLAANAKSSSISGLLEPAWNAVRLRNGSYEQAIINNDLTYWRSILYVLLMVIRFHVNRTPKSTTIPGTSTSVVLLDPANIIFLEITSQIVAEGLQTVVSALQEQKLGSSRLKNGGDVQVGERDVVLVMTILQAILKLPNLAQFSSELSQRISSSGLISSCLLLYSWSHLLTNAEDDHQPRYADLCAQLLATLSSLPLVAEELAVEGVLNRILTSKTTEILQRVPGGASHADQRPNCAILYKMWAGGLLSLCLNLLHAIGGGIASEVSNFLNQFPNQLARASSSFMLALHTRKEGTDVLTLAVANEASTLALISYMLSSFRQAGASAAVDPETVLPLAGYDEHRKAIIDDLKDVLALKPELRKKVTVPMDEREVTWQSSGDGNVLDTKLTKEIRLALIALRREEDDDDDEK